MDIKTFILTEFLFVILFILSIPVHEIGHVLGLKIVSWLDRRAKIEILEINLLHLGFGIKSEDLADCAGYVKYIVLGRLTFSEILFISFSGGIFASSFFGSLAFLCHIFSVSNVVTGLLILVAFGQFICGLWEISDKFTKGG